MDNNEQRKIIEYWTYVYNSLQGVELTQITCESDDLKSFINAIISSHLLNQIECHFLAENHQTKHNINNVPFSTWLLQRLIKAASVSKLSQDTRQFYVKAQGKLLQATYDKSPSQFFFLAELYINSIYCLLESDEKIEFFCLENTETLFSSTIVLKSLPFAIQSENERLNILDVFVKVLCEVQTLFGYASKIMVTKLWTVIAGITSSGYTNMLYSIIPLLCELVRRKLVFDNTTHIKTVMIHLPLVIPHMSSIFCEQYFITLWCNLKSMVTLGHGDYYHIIENLVQIKDNQINSEFVLSEIGFFVKQCSNKNTIENVLSRCKWEESTIIIKELVISDLKEYLDLNVFETSHDHSSNTKWIDVQTASDNWKKLIGDFSQFLNAPEPVIFISQLVKVAHEISDSVECPTKPFKKGIKFKLKFFGNFFTVAVQKLGDLIEKSYSHSSLLCDTAWTALVKIVNLPEVSLITARSILPVINYLEFRLKSFNSLADNVKSYLIRIILSNPPGLTRSMYWRIFQENCTTTNADISICKLILSSIPCYCLKVFENQNSEISFAQVIADILLPASLLENEKVQLAVVFSLTDFTCVVAGTGNVVRGNRISCCQCEEYCSNSDISNSNVNLEAHISKLLETLLSTPFPAVRKQLLLAIPRLTTHLKTIREKPLVEPFIKLVKDCDQGVMDAFSRNLPTLIFGKSDVASHGDLKDNTYYLPALKACFDVLEKEIKNILFNEPWGHKQYNMLSCLANIGCYPVREALKPSLCLIIQFVPYSPFALDDIISRIAVAHNTTTSKLYYLFKPEFCQIFANQVISNFCRYRTPVNQTMMGITSLFREISVGRCLQGSEHFIVPNLVLKVTRYPALKLCLDELAAFFSKPTSMLLTQNFHSIFCYVWRETDEVEFEKCLSFVVKESNFSVFDLIVQSQKQLIHELLFHYHTDENKILRGIHRVLGILTNDSLPSTGPISSHVANALESRFVGFLLFAVGKFTKDYIAECEQSQAILSLTCVLKLMGQKFVNLVSRKVLSTLMAMLNLEKRIYAELICECWYTFTTVVDCREIGPLLATIVVSILQLFPYCPEGVSRILSYLIIDNEMVFATHLPALTFIPNSPILSDVNRTLRKYVDFSGEDIKDRLNRETLLSTHETVDIRIHGLQALNSSLKSFAKDVRNLILGSDDPHSVIISLWEALTICCRDPEKNVSLGAALCFGQLGALDPGLLPRKLKPIRSLPLSVDLPTFGQLALTELAHHFQNARSSVDMDAFAIAIQELLKMYEIGTDSELWASFSDLEKSLMTPMLTSRYKINCLTNKVVWPDVIFGTKDANTHIAWASNWAGKLISFCKDDKSKSLFRACEPCMKRDPAVLQLFLRYILVQIIFQNNTEEAGVYNEINAVIDYCLTTVEQGDNSSNRDTHLNFIDPREGRMCAMTIFLMIDFAQFWKRRFLVENATLNADHLKKPEYLRFKEFLSMLDVNRIINCNYNLLEYPRTVQYLEDMISDSPDCLPAYLTMLSKTFALYGDLDNVHGASTLQQTAPSIEDQLFYHQASKQLEELRVTYERLCEEGPLTINQIEGMIQCYLRLGEPAVALNIINSYESKQSELYPILTEHTIESMLKLGDWKLLETFMNSENEKLSHGWFKDLGEIALGIKNADNQSEKIALTRLSIIENFKAFGIQSVNEQQLYPCLLKFQILYEFQQVIDVLNEKYMDMSAIQLLIDDWAAKTNLLQSDGESLEQLFSFRRNLLSLLVTKIPATYSKIINNEIGEYWNKSAGLARKAGCYHQAYNYILNAEKFKISATFVEKAQLFWDKGDHETCLMTLTHGLRDIFPDASTMKDLPSGQSLPDRKVCAEAKLLFAIYNEETSNCDSYTNMTNYQEAFDVCRQLEKTQVHLGQCLDRVVNRMDEEEQDNSKACDLRVMIVNHFGKSLTNGCEFIYQTVPRMLAIWLDLGENLKTGDRLKAMQKINKMIQQFNEKLPPFVFMTALPQLLSRIVHTNREVFLILKSILASLIRTFPQQCLWAIQTVAKSSIPDRCMRYKEVIQDMSLRTAETFKLIEDMTLLCEKLNRLTNKNLPADAVTRNLNVSSLVRELPLLFNSNNFSSVILPITKCCKISLPTTNTLHSYVPFPKNPVTIISLKNELTVLPSLQRPRKISFVGSDGRVYDILCKPKDDLRRDARLMEFNNIVNMYLHRDPEARARHLHIRTYVVTPLGENGGLLEWIPNLVGLRPALIQLYKQHGKYTTTREVKKLECLVRDPIAKKREVFLQKLLPAHPPIFHEWFRLMFCDPAGWYAARQAYIRTTAVMSMVGYILGLGDRHGENILFDCESGDTVHVDFNCLFNKGENFDWKERVPFRLTHNMIVAMGPCGLEGTFRKACEVSMRVLQAQSKTLMSILTPFAYDPSGSWSKNKEIGQQDRDQKISEALEELNDIDKRLKGSLRVKQKNNKFYLSVEGLVRALIADATNTDNLCQMYLGWGAYL